MRIDLLLSKLCLTKTRSIAKNACDKNLVRVNDKTIKASHEVKARDFISFDLYGFKHNIQLIEIPIGNVAKKDAGDYYTLLDKTKLE
jgi:ribosomal 50S subunit-recycling heat shock protein